MDEEEVVGCGPGDVGEEQAYRFGADRWFEGVDVQALTGHDYGPCNGDADETLSVLREALEERPDGVEDQHGYGAPHAGWRETAKQGQPRDDQEKDEKSRILRLNHSERNEIRTGHHLFNAWLLIVSDELVPRARSASREDAVKEE